MPTSITSPLPGENVFLQQKLAGEIVLQCATPGFLPGVSLSWENATPPQTWFALAVQAGQVLTGETPKPLRVAIERCYHEALKDKSELGSVDLPKAKIECQAFTRDGGAVTLTISVDDGKDRDPPEPK